MANEYLSVVSFLNHRLEDIVPDHTGISRFKAQLVEKDAFDSIIMPINHQLAAFWVVGQTGVKTDVSISSSPGKPKGKTTYLIAEDRKADEASAAQVEKQNYGRAL